MLTAPKPGHPAGMLQNSAHSLLDKASQKLSSNCAAATAWHACQKPNRSRAQKQIRWTNRSAGCSMAASRRAPASPTDSRLQHARSCVHNAAGQSGRAWPPPPDRMGPSRRNSRRPLHGLKSRQVMGSMRARMCARCVACRTHPRHGDLQATDHPAWLRVGRARD